MTERHGNTPGGRGRDGAGGHRDGIECEVVDCRSLAPLDEATLCAAAACTGQVTGIPFHFHGPGADSNLLPSVDRIDSDGHYETGNIQIVCRFVNFWKSDTDDEEFRRLLMLVRGEDETE